VEASSSNGPRCPSVCYSNGKPGFPIQNLPSDSRLEVRFCHFGCFWIGTSPIQTEMGQLNVVDRSVGTTITSWHHTGHRGRPAIITSHNRRYFVDKSSANLLLWGSQNELKTVTISVIVLLLWDISCLHYLLQLTILKDFKFGVLQEREHCVKDSRFPSISPHVFLSVSLSVHMSASTFSLQRIIVIMV